MKNSFKMEVDAILQNEGFIRSTIANFVLPLEPTVTEINDIKTAVSEAVTNCIVHGYNNQSGHKIFIECSVENGTLSVCIRDNGVGIPDIAKAREPFFTTKKDQERSGMGFTLMETFMDSLEVSNNAEGGISVYMTKQICG